MRIGLLDQTFKSWSAGAIFTRMMLTSLELAKDDRDTEVIFLSRSKENIPPTSFKSIFIGEQPDRAQWRERMKDAGLDLVIPVCDPTLLDPELPFVGWIPDFQHLRLPELFDPGELRYRDQLFSAIAEKASVILLSSESVRMDFGDFFPAQAAKARVIRFPSLLWTLDLGDDGATLSKYHLPQKFALVANQFWRHKNHRILPAALGLLKRRRMEINLVVTGLPSDYRDPENKSLSQFFQESAKEDVMGSIHFLGQIPYGDLVAIMRAAALIIQPSFFEGWSTSIEDSKALGRPLVCSDIPVHREQVPDALGFFDPKKPEMLADLLAEIYGDLGFGPDLQREEDSIALARKRASDYGRYLFEMTEEAADLHEKERIATRLRKVESLLKEQSNYIKELEQKLNELKQELDDRKSDFRSELSRLRKWNHYLRRQSLVEFISRNIRLRWRLVRKRSPHLRKKRRSSNP